MKRSPLSLEGWPTADRKVWGAIVASGDILDASGPGAQWRPVTRNLITRDYGYWLSFLQARGVDLASKPPLDRVSPERVREYVADINHLAASTRAGRLRALAILVTYADRARDWKWLVRILRFLDGEERRDRGRRNQDRVVASHKLVEAGVRHMQEANLNEALKPRGRAILFRDGLMIALLASRPLRRRNFAELRLGRHLHQTPAGYRIEIVGAETKNGKMIETTIPEDLLTWLKQYIEMHRRVLLRGAESDYLWVTKDGLPYSPRHLGERITEATRRLLGIAVRPHDFRRSAATTISSCDPEHVRTVAPLLGNSPATAELYYIKARTIEAGRAHQKNLALLRKKLRPARRRTNRGRR